MTDTEPLTADRIAEVQVMEEPELLALWDSVRDGPSAPGLIEAIDERLDQFDVAAGMKAHGEEFARTILRIVERRSAAGGWVWAEDAFRVAVAESRASPYIAYIAENPARHTRFAAILERIRAAEFLHLDRQKDGTWQGARVYFRARRRD